MAELMRSVTVEVTVETTKQTYGTGVVEVGSLEEAEAVVRRFREERAE